MTAGSGVVHAELFPLLNRDKPNPAELFQIWLNLPAANKMVPAHYIMLWNEQIPRVRHTDLHGRATEIVVVAGSLAGIQPLNPPPHSWAARGSSEVAIWTIKMEAGATWQLPAASSDINRTLYFFSGSGVDVDGVSVPSYSGIALHSETAAKVTAGSGLCELLLLQGRPLGEPVVTYGPFVMNSKAEIEQAFVDYRRTGFGGWPWPVPDPSHGRDRGRFARHADGREEKPGN